MPGAPHCTAPLPLPGAAAAAAAGGFQLLQEEGVGWQAWRAGAQLVSRMVGRADDGAAALL